MQQYGLAIHTTSPDLGLAIDNFRGNSRRQIWSLGREVSNYLHVNLAEFLHPQTWQDLAFIAVANGPGGFTGTRLGVVTARSLAQELEIPLFAVSALAAIAWKEPPPTDATIAIQMPAQRGELFAAIYQRSSSQLTPILADTVISVANWQQRLDRAAPDRLTQAENGQGESVSSVLELAQAEWSRGIRPHWSEALPFYGQHPIAAPP